MLPEQQDLLIGLAQLAAVLMGFLAILVVFVREDGRLGPDDALRGRSILYNAQSVLVGAILPLVLAANGLPADAVWRIAALVMIAQGAVTFIEGVRFNLRMPIENRRRIGVGTAIMSWGGSTLALAALILVAGGWAGFGGLIAAAGLCLWVASYNFVVMAVRRWL